MKGRGFLFRAACALQGMRAAFRSESSFRTQVAAAVLAACATLLIRPPLVWAALVAAMIALVLAAELFNTALEHVLDALHPGDAEFVRIAKDCAAAAVLVLSILSVAVFCMMLAAVY